MISQLTDPFNSSVTTDPWSSAVVDVPTIHQAVFNNCLATLEQVRQLPGTPTRSILIYGSAGSGKTHLLGRLRNSVVGTQPLRPAIFCYVRLATSPAMICRHVRRCLATDLLRPNQAGICQLDLVLLSRLCEKPANSASAARYLERLRQSSEEQAKLANAIATLDGKSGLGRNFATACEHWLLRRHRRDVADWFREGELPDTIRTSLGFVRDPVSADEDPEGAAYDLVLRWTRLIGPARPLVLCFDQIEALKTDIDKSNGLSLFGRFVANLYEEARSTLLITCAQSAFQAQLMRDIRDADFPRVAGEILTISPLTRPECETLLIAILDGTADLASHNHRDSSRLWPLEQSQLDRLCENGTCTPRELIGYCRDAVRAWRSGMPYRRTSRPDPCRFLSKAFEERRENYLGCVEDTQTTLAHGLPQLMSLVGGATVEPSDRPDIIECKLKKGEKQVQVSVCNQKHNALPARLKKVQQSGLPIEQVVLLRDSTQPIPKTSPVAKQRWVDLQNRGARLVRPSAEVLSAIEALRSLLSEAQAGDLASDGATVEPRTVEEWVRTKLLDEDLERLVTEILHTPAEIIQGETERSLQDSVAADEIFNDLLESLRKLHVADVATLASKLERTPPEVISCVQQHGPEFGLIGDPPSVVFEKCVAKQQG